jgi:nicotinamidase-related amidase
MTKSYLNIQLLIMDGQAGFCDPGGALCVPGAGGDMGRRLATTMEENG